MKTKKIDMDTFNINDKKFKLRKIEIEIHDDNGNVIERLEGHGRVKINDDLKAIWEFEDGALKY